MEGISVDNIPILVPESQLNSRLFDNETRYQLLNGSHCTYSILNKTGYEAVKLINGKRTVSDIADQMSINYLIDPKRVREDILKLFSTLYRKKLIFFRGEEPPAILETHHEPHIEEAWLHVTNQCNLRCITCFKNSGSKYNNELSLAHIHQIIDDLLQLDVRRIVVSGGEPLMRPDLFDILTHIKNNGQSILLVTNGTLINDSIADQLAKIHPDIIQVSIDGTKKEIHEKIRGAGTFEPALEGARQLIERGLDVRLYPTLNQLNKDDLPDFPDLIQKLRPGFNHFAYAIFTPTGRGKNFKSKLELSLSELNEAEMKIRAKMRKLIENANTRSGPNLIDIERIAWGTRKINCGLAGGVISIDADGTVYPCQWLHEPDFVLGNLQKESIFDIYFNSRRALLLRNLRVDRDFAECHKCQYRYFCGGGCRARAFLSNASLNSCDPLCQTYYNYFDFGLWGESTE